MTEPSKTPSGRLYCTRPHVLEHDIRIDEIEEVILEQRQVGTILLQIGTAVAENAISRSRTIGLGTRVPKILGWGNRSLCQRARLLS